jgi:hypothetical protein
VAGRQHARLCGSAAVIIVSLIGTSAAAEDTPVTQVQLAYDTYAAAMEVMRMDVSFSLGPWNYRINLDYHTTGLVGFFYRGHQVNTVHGNWDNGRAEPLEFSGDGVWHGRERRTLIDYDNGQPDVKILLPPQESEREPVPREMQLHTMDTLSALAQLMRNVEIKHDCNTTVRTYDGRRVLEIVARDGGSETLAASGRSSFSGRALRCDFEGRELAGFLIGEDNSDNRKPLHGSAWLATVPPYISPLPVRIEFQTRWFGEARMYLTNITPGDSPDR